MAQELNTEGLGEEVDPLAPIWEAIWKKTPVLREVMTRHGQDASLARYADGFLEINPTPALDQRRGEFNGMIRRLLADRLGDEVAQPVEAQLSKYPLVSTTDHHGTITHPYWINSNILSALPYLEAADPLLRYLVVLSFASVSLNNASAFPRGVVFHGNNRGTEDMVRLPIFPDKEKMATVYNMRPFKAEDLAQAKKTLSKKVKDGAVLADRAKAVESMLDAIFQDEDVLGAPDLATQITKLNFKLWPTYFKEEGPRVPDLVYLDIETLVRELLLENHLSQPDSLMFKLLFDEQYQVLAREYFNGIPGAFDLDKGTGTYFFWGLDEKNHRIQLDLREGHLISQDGRYSCEYTPAALSDALKGRKVFPSMLLCYVMAACHYGYKCLGGFSQVSDLTQTKEAWMRLLKEVGEASEAEAIEPVQTKDMTAGGTVVSFMQTQTGGVMPASGVDMAINRDRLSFEQYGDFAQRVTFMETMDPMVVATYKVLVPEDQRDPRFLGWNPESIMDLRKLNQRVTAGAM